MAHNKQQGSLVLGQVVVPFNSSVDIDLMDALDLGKLNNSKSCYFCLKPL